MPAADRMIAADLSCLADDLVALLENLEDAAADAGRAAAGCEAIGDHPAIAGGAYRVRDHLQHALLMVTAATGHLASVRAARLGPAQPVQLPTEAERRGGAYPARQRPAEGDAATLAPYFRPAPDFRL